MNSPWITRYEILHEITASYDLAWLVIVLYSMHMYVMYVAQHTKAYFVVLREARIVKYFSLAPPHADHKARKSSARTLPTIPAAIHNA